MTQNIFRTLSLKVIKLEAFKVYYSHWSKMSSHRPALVGWCFDFNSSVLSTYYVIPVIVKFCFKITMFHGIVRFDAKFKTRRKCFIVGPQSKSICGFKMTSRSWLWIGINERVLFLRLHQWSILALRGMIAFMIGSSKIHFLLNL